MTIIGICGFKSSGKDTISDFLVSNYGFKKLSFADSLKDVVAIMFDWDRNKLEGLNEDDREWRETIDTYWSNTLNIPNLTPRYVLQYFGTELFRNNFHKDIWVKIVERNISKYKNVVISDCRFPNEIDMVQRNGGIIIHVYKSLPNWFWKYRNNFGELSDVHIADMNKMHMSELEWICCNIDHHVHNNGTKNILYEKIKMLI